MTDTVTTRSKFRFASAITFPMLLLTGCYKGDACSPLASPGPQVHAFASFVPRVLANQQGRPGKDVYDLIAAFSPSHLTDKRRVGTPTGDGILIMNLPSDGTRPKSLVLLASFSYTYPIINVKAKQFLELRAADTWSTGAGVRAVVEASSGGKHDVIFTHDFAPFGSDPGPDWEVFDLPLQRFAGKSVQFKISSETIANDDTAAWLAISRAEIKESK